MDHDRVSHPSLADVPQSVWTTLSQRKTYFGHHSVGDNILSGLRDLMKEHSQIELRIVETSNPADFDRPVFAHSRVGRNTDPQSKIEAFAEYMEAGVAERVDIALFKFCYVDVTAGTEIGSLFASYRDTMARLRMRFPEVVFVHVTVPLTVLQMGLKARIKKFVGRPVRGLGDNIRRHRYNEMVRKEYTGREPVFDLSDREAALPDGRRTAYMAYGDAFPALVPVYTDDGGHLNQTGRRIVAEQLLVLLASLT